VFDVVHFSWTGQEDIRKIVKESKVPEYIWVINSGFWEDLSSRFKAGKSSALLFRKLKLVDALHICSHCNLIQK